MHLQKLLSYTRRAIDDYSMIEENDKIAIGISGGKDSLTLLYALKGLQRFYPKHFEIIAITIDLGFGIQDLDKIAKLCDEMNVEYYVEKTDISNIVFNERKESNPCSLCAKMRKGSLNDIAKSKGCNKIAYAHHKDDVIDTVFLSLFYEGRFHCFSPVTYLSRIDLTLIRPLIYASESEIIGFSKETNLPIAKGKCPIDGFTKRQYVKDVIDYLYKDNKDIKERVFTAISDSTLDGWDKKRKRD